MAIATALSTLSTLSTLALATEGCSTPELSESSESAVEVTDPAVALEQLAAARAKLDARLAEAGGSYQYEVPGVGEGELDGVRLNTTVIVQRGRPVQRMLASYPSDDPDEGFPTFGGELGSDLGSTPGGYAPAVGIEALYDECASILSQPPTTRPRLTLDADGLVSSCLSTMLHCTERCEVGVRIERLQPFDLKKPLAALERMIASARGDYEYSTTRHDESGVAKKTTVAFRANAPFRRVYEAISEGAVVSSWTEDATQIGSHEEGAAARSLGELYATCRDEVLASDPTDSYLWLSFDRAGVLKECQVQPSGCMDDCATGVMLDEVQLAVSGP